MKDIILTIKDILLTIIITISALWLLSLGGCGNDGEKDRTKTTPTVCTDGQDGLPGADGNDGDTGPEGPQGEAGPQGEPGVDGSSCRAIEKLVYDDDGEVRERKCDIYLKCDDREVFVTRKKYACEDVTE